jgi:hypothetical protein
VPSQDAAFITNSQRLPSFSSSEQLEITWGSFSEDQIVANLTQAFEVIVHWKPNLFMTPSGHQGNCFVDEMTRLFNAFNSDSAMQSIAIKAAMIFPALMLQKPSPKSKTRDHMRILKRRLELWTEGDILSLLKEGQLIQKQLHRHLKVSNRMTDLRIDLQN